MLGTRRWTDVRVRSRQMYDGNAAVNRRTGAEQTSVRTAPQLTERSLNVEKAETERRAERHVFPDYVPGTSGTRSLPPA